MKKLLLGFLLYSLASIAHAAGCAGTGACYWVGGSGNASDTAHWATASGGAVTGSIPTSADNCTFDTSSSTANAAYTVTMDATTTCKDFTMAGPGAGNKVTVSGAAALDVYGNFTLSGGTAGITKNWAATLTMRATSGTKTIDLNGLTHGQLTLNGAGAIFQLASDYSFVSSGFTQTAGTFDANGKTVTFLNANPAITGLAGLTFYNLTYNPTTPLKTGSITLFSSITVSNLLTISAGATATNRVFIASSVTGLQRTITAASISIDNADFMDIVGAGAASWDMSAAAHGSGNCGGNTMQALGDAAFTTPADQHWVKAGGAGGNWSDATAWTSRVPLCQDNVFLDNAFGTAQAITMDMPRLGKSVDFTGATWTTSLTMNSGLSNSVFGSLTLISGLTIAATGNGVIFAGRGSNTIDTKSVTIDRPITLNGPTGTYTLASDFTIGATRLLALTAGSLSNGGGANVISAGNINIAPTFAGLTLGSATHLVTGSGVTAWSQNNASLIFNAGTSTIKFTDSTNSDLTFSGGGASIAPYYNIWFSRGASTGAIKIAGNNTYNDVKDDGTAAHSIIVNAATTHRLNSFTVSGSAGNLITLDSSTTAPYKLIKLTPGTISSDYLSVAHTFAYPACAWFAGTHSSNGGANYGWNFRATFTCSKSMQAIF